MDHISTYSDFQLHTYYILNTSVILTLFCIILAPGALISVSNMHSTACTRVFATLDGDCQLCDQRHIFVSLMSLDKRPRWQHQLLMHMTSLYSARMQAP